MNEPTSNEMKRKTQAHQREEAYEQQIRIMTAKLKEVRKLIASVNLGSFFVSF